MARVNLGRVIGRSAYEEAVRLGYKGSELQWLNSLNGKDAYTIACELGYKGSIEEWLKSIEGESAYAQAVKGGFTDSEEEFNIQLASIGNLNEILDLLNGEVV